jgi:hypothetical protein
VKPADHLARFSMLVITSFSVQPDMKIAFRYLWAPAKASIGKPDESGYGIQSHI